MTKLGFEGEGKAFPAGKMGCRSIGKSYFDVGATYNHAAELGIYPGGRLAQRVFTNRIYPVEKKAWFVRTRTKAALVDVRNVSLTNLNYPPSFSATADEHFLRFHVSLFTSICPHLSPTFFTLKG